MVGESGRPSASWAVMVEGVAGRPGRGVRRAEASSSVSSDEGVLGSSRVDGKVGKLDRRDGGLFAFVGVDGVELIESLGLPIHPSRLPRGTFDVEVSVSFPFPFASPAHHFPIPESVPSTTPAPPL